MTNIEPVDPIKVKYEEVNKYFGGRLPNHIHHPIQFAHYLKLYQYYINRSNKAQQ